MVVIDLQRDFLDDGQAAIQGTTDVVPKVASLVKAFRRAGRTAVHVVRLYSPGSSDVDLLRRDVIEAGAEVAALETGGSQVAEGVLPQGFRLDSELLLAGKTQTVGPCGIVLFKTRWSTFHRTDLESLLHRQDCDTVAELSASDSVRRERTGLSDCAGHRCLSQTSFERLTDLERIGVNRFRRAWGACVAWAG